jgi:hypothetical protein
MLLLLQLLLQLLLPAARRLPASCVARTVASLGLWCCSPGCGPLWPPHPPCLSVLPCTPPSLYQVREDVTRYRYGDEQHLDEALTRIFRWA